MNNEQLQDWLTELNERLGNVSEQESTAYTNQNRCGEWRKILDELSPNTNIFINYFMCNFQDIRLSEPLIAQILSLYYRFGVARCFVLQLIPTLINAYLKSLKKKWYECVEIFDTFFMAIYNEEILAPGPGSPSMSKRFDEVRIPSFRGSIDAIKLTMSPIADPIFNQNLTNTRSTPGVKNSVRIGPFPAVDKIISENRYMILTRLMRSVNNHLGQMSIDVIYRSSCRSVLNICRSGFSFNESDFRHRILKENASSEVFGDFARKSRIPVSPNFLIECINIICFAIFNGQADIALRALDAVHQRSHYEMFANVLLETNALRKTLSEPQTIQLISHPPSMD